MSIDTARPIYVSATEHGAVAIGQGGNGTTLGAPIPCPTPGHVLALVADRFATDQDDRADVWRRTVKARPTVGGWSLGAVDPTLCAHLRPRTDGRYEVTWTAAADEAHGCMADTDCILTDGHDGDCWSDREVHPELWTTTDAARPC